MSPAAAIPRAACRLLILLAMLVPAAPAAADLDDGLTAIRARDYERGLREVTPAAEAGDARAQTVLANLYRRGLGTARDFGQAAKWYRRAAEQGYALAQYNLGVMYREGLGVPQDDALAAQWYLAAAVQGFIPAQINLALRYAHGLGVPGDDVRAYAWLHRAALQGNREAMEKRELLAARMTEEQIRSARELAETLY